MALPSRTLLPGVTTGVFTMKISTFLGRRLVLPFHGVPFTGSFGSTRRAGSVSRGCKLLQALESLWQILRVPTGFCFTFHRGGDCMGCSFRHDCFKCRGFHRALNCNSILSSVYVTTKSHKMRMRIAVLSVSLVKFVVRE